MQYSYTSKESIAGAALSEWAFEAHVGCKTLVLPDGCRDLIVQDSPEEGTCTWFISDLSQSTYEVKTSAGQRMTGIRLQPGVTIKLSELETWLHNRYPYELLGTDQIDEFCDRSRQLAEVLDCLASGVPTVQCAAQDLGVSVRSVQRIVKAGTQRSPHFWLSLARIRRAGRLLSDCDSLGDAAFACGFSDQAHMTREMKKWFKATPYQIKVDEEMRALLNESGYG